MLILVGEFVSVAAVFGSGEIPSKPQRAPAVHLNAGQTIVQLVHGAMVFNYTIDLQRDEFLEASVLPWNTNVTVVLFDPREKPLLRFESVSGLPLATLLTVAEVSGLYRLQVTAAFRGRFSLRLARPHSATTADRARAQAALLLAESSLLCPRLGSKACSQVVPSYTEALQLWRTAVDSGPIALTYYLRGRALLHKGDFPQAKDSFEEAARWFAKAADHAAAAVAEGGASEASYYSGDYRAALDISGRVREACHKNGNRACEVEALSNIASAEQKLSRTQDAVEHYRQALAGKEELGRQSDEAVGLMNLGVLYLDMEEPRQALEHCEKAWEILRSQPGKLPTRIRTLVCTGLARFRSGLASQGVHDLETALSLAQDDTTYELLVLSNLGFVQIEIGDSSAAMRSLTTARKLAKKPGEVGVLSAYLAQLHYQRKEFQDALPLFAEATAGFHSVEDHSSEAKALFGVALTQWRLGNSSVALDSVEKSIALGESLRTATYNQELRSSFFSLMRQRYELEVELLMEKGDVAKAFEASERARARSVLDELAEAHADIRSGAPSRILGTLARIREQIQENDTKLQQLRSAGLNPQRTAKLAAQRDALAHEYDLALAEMRAASPRYAALVHPAPSTLSTIQNEVLEPNSVLLSYFVSEPRSFLWLVRRNGVGCVELPGRRAIENEVRGLVPTISRLPQRIAQGDDIRAIVKLSKVIMPPEVGALVEKRLLIIPDGALQYVPFAALSEPALEAAAGNRLLIDNHELVELPSASAIALLRRGRRTRRPPPMTVAVFADPVFGTDDPRLQGPRSSRARSASPALPRLLFTKKEAEVIRDLVPASKRLMALGFDANLDKVRSERLDRFRLIHFATHGSLDPRSTLSGIYLSQLDDKGRPRDGFLHALDAYELDLHADLVVLSACETGSGNDLRSEGVGRLTRAFLYAGAGSVAVSLWKVSDSSTASLMGKLYSGMLNEGLSPSAALAKAQHAIRLQKPNPYYWAGFVLQGDWR